MGRFGRLRERGERTVLETWEQLPIGSYLRHFTFVPVYCPPHSNEKQTEES